MDDWLWREPDRRLRLWAGNSPDIMDQSSVYLCPPDEFRYQEWWLYIPSYAGSLPHFLMRVYPSGVLDGIVPSRKHNIDPIILYEEA